MNIEERSVNTIRMLSIDQIQKANSGHPGLPLGCAPMAYELWANHMNHNPNDLKWINRDRFILSAGHGSAMLYSLLHLFGYGLSIEDLKNFRQIGSLTPGHPEYRHTKGVEATTGPLGQGISMAVGMAMAERHLAAIYNTEYKIIDHYTYVICGDGDLMEGISNEACSLAGTLSLGKLIVLYDSNKITIEGNTDLAFREDVLKRFEGLGWQTLEVKDGNSLREISEQIEEAKEDERPTIIKINTTIGYGSPVQGNAKVHGAPLGLENIKKTREFFGFPDEDFYVDEEVRKNFQEKIKNLSINYDAWKRTEELYKEKYPEKYKELVDNFNGKFDLSIFEDEDYYKFDEDLATRAYSGKCLNRIAEKVNYLFGGSADLAPSNNTNMKNSNNFSAEDSMGNNINFGVREHGMAAISNGIILHGGLKSYGATFLVFSDYMKGAIRLSALQQIPNIYILTHDSIGVGEDGPTHQPIEHLPMLRSIPNTIVFRPCDGKETAVAWKVALSSTSTPVCLILSRQKLPNLNSSLDSEKGAYIIKKEAKDLKTIVIATGSEVELAIKAAKDFDGVRVVSMPSRELFEAQTKEYREMILPSSCRNRISVEAASTFGWEKYTGLDGINIGIDEFGQSGPGSQVFKYYGIDEDHIRNAILSFEN